MSTDAPASPCVRQCCLDGAGEVCLGCFRSLDEIRAWQAADAAERLRILARCALRREAAGAASRSPR